LSSIGNKAKDFLLDLYLSPVNRSTRLAMSVKNRILPDIQHLKGLTFTINSLTKGYSPDSLVIDIGCFNGSTSILFQKELKDVRVIGFEPSKQSFETALKNTAGLPGIKIENYAVSDFCGVTEFFVTDNKVSSSLNPLTGADTRFSTQTVEKVEIITLDEYFKRNGIQEEKVLAVKLDVQGHELKVLRGAANTLKRTMFVLTELSNHESYEGGARYFEVDQAMRENGFVLQNIFSSYSYGKQLYEYDALYINSIFI
jgi:FkbM family methyltransferase